MKAVVAVLALSACVPAPGFRGTENDASIGPDSLGSDGSVDAPTDAPVPVCPTFSALTGVTIGADRYTELAAVVLDQNFLVAVGAGDLWRVTPLSGMPIGETRITTDGGYTRAAVTPTGDYLHAAQAGTIFGAPLAGTQLGQRVTTSGLTALGGIADTGAGYRMVVQKSGSLVTYASPSIPPMWTMSDSMPSNAADPSLSPDGLRLAYVVAGSGTERSVWVASRADTDTPFDLASATRVIQLMGPIATPKVSNDCRHLFIVAAGRIISYQTVAAIVGP